MITDKSSDGTQIVTRKMVLEVDPTSKEEIVEIHPELCEKLKPHQVKGIKLASYSELCFEKLNICMCI